MNLLSLTAAVALLAAASAAPTPVPTALRGSYGSVGFHAEILQNTSYGISCVAAGDIDGVYLNLGCVCLSFRRAVAWGISCKPVAQ